MRQHQRQSLAKLPANLFVALGLGGLTLQRIDLARDLLQDVVDAIEILAGAFQLQLGQPLARLNLVTPAASSTNARRSIGFELRICPMRPCSMMA